MAVKGIIKRSADILFSCSPAETIVSFMVQIIRSLIPVVTLYLVKYFVDATVEAGSQGVLSAIGSSMKLILLISAAILTDDLLAALSAYITRKESYKVEGYISSLIHRHSSSLGFSHFEDPSFHDRLSRAERDITWRPAALISDAALVIRGVVSFAAMAYVLRNFGLVPILLLVIVFIPVLVIRAISSGRFYRVRKMVTAESRLASYFSWLLTGEKPAKEIRLFGSASLFEGQFREHYKAAKEPELKITGTSSLLDGLSSLFKVAAFALLLLFTTRAYLGKGISAGEMAMYLVGFRQAFVYLRDIISGLSRLHENRIFLSDLFGFLDIEPEQRIPGDEGRLPHFNDLKVENLSYTYPGSDLPALKNINIRIANGEKVALVGANGSGKSTLVKILCRLYEPDSGAVFLNGFNILSYDPVEYRKLFSVVFQDFMLYHISVTGNISLSGDSPPDMDRVKEAARRSELSDIVKRMTQGYDTVLGRQTGGSRDLSWGEWQKIAVARALYRKAPVLILDEPSSSLDADSEYEILSEINKITEGRTSLFISHRLSYVKNADRIIVLDKGMIAEEGTHEELMRLKGRYFSMYSRQQLQYS